MSRLLFTLLTCLFTLLLLGQQTTKSITIGGIGINLPVHTEPSQTFLKSVCDSMFSFPINDYPSGLATDGNFIWYVNSEYIFKTTTDGIHLDSFENPAELVIIRGGGLTYDGRYLWYCDEQSAEFFKIDPSTGTPLSRFRLPSARMYDPNIFGIAWDGSQIWLSQYDPPMLYQFDPTSEIFTDSVEISNESIAIEWIEGELFGRSHYQNQKLYHIDPDSGSTIDSIAWCIPNTVGITWKDTELYALSGVDTFFQVITGGTQRIYGIESDFFPHDLDSEMDSDGITIFPNPSTEGIIVEGEAIESIELYNIAGALIKKQVALENRQRIEVYFSGLPTGIYLVIIHQESAVITRRILIR